MEYEHLLPNDEFEQYAVSFELRIPSEIACLRDTLFGFTTYCSGSAGYLNVRGTWISARSEVSRYSQSTSQYIKLGSTTRRSMNKHHVDCSFDTFIVNNTFNCTFYASNSSMPKSISDDSIKNACTFKTTDEYQSLQWTLDSTAHTQIQVLSSQCKCPQELSLSEYKNFGSLRSDGHRLQLRKLYAMIRTEALSFEKESVLSLVMQTLWECGISGDGKLVRESHSDFNDPNFCLAIIELLIEFVKQQRDNWIHPLKLLTATFIAIRAFEINDSDSIAIEIVNLLKSIRYIALDWIEKINNTIHMGKNSNEKTKRELRLKLIYVAITGAMTFFIHPQHKYYKRIFSNDIHNNLTAYGMWLQFNIAKKNNILMYTSNENCLPSNLQMFLRLTESIGVHLEPTIKTMIKQNPTEAYNLIQKQWSRAIHQSFKKYYFYKIFPQILVVDAVINSVKNIITIDIITGQFLVNGLPVSLLPSKITKSKIYQRFFGNVAFEVQPDGTNTYTTVQTYAGCSYEFKIDKTIVIKERKIGKWEKELVPHEMFEHEFSYFLINDYTHWLNDEAKCIEFRPRTFDRQHFSTETTVVYQLHFDIESSHKKLWPLIHVKTKRAMLNITKPSYRKIVDQLSRLEQSKYIHVLLERSDVATAELFRMNLKFKIEVPKSQQGEIVLKSNEFSGMFVSRTQNIGTLYGLNHGLILENCSNAKTKILLIPHGSIRSKCSNSHVSIDIDTADDLRNPPFFQYQVDEFCQQFKASNRSHTSWFYLAYLHAVTSHGEVEPFIGMSDTERALQILQSAFCWSTSPYEPEALEMLTAIAKLTPIRKTRNNYQIVEWPTNVHPRAAQDCFVFIVQKLLEDSQRLHGLYFKNSDAVLKIESNLKLNARDHRRCQQLNPNLLVSSKFIEHEELKTSLPKPIHVSFASNTQIVSISYHRQKCYVKNSLKLKDFLTSGSQLNGIANMECLPNLLIHNVYEGFRDLWIRLYYFARKQKFNREQLALILSVFAHEEKEIEPILALQAVAMNPNAFLDPPLVSIFHISEGTYKANVVSSVLRNYYTKPFELRIDYSASFYDDEETKAQKREKKAEQMGKQKVHDSQLKLIIDSLTFDGSSYSTMAM